jgi:hypothetical protein
MTNLYRSHRLPFLLLFVLCSSGVLAQGNGKLTIDSVSMYFDRNLDVFLSELHRGKFLVCNKKSAIPLFIKDKLEAATGGFSIANPSEEFACCCTSSAKLPRRKLIYLAKSHDILIMSYLTGGIGESTHILLIKFKDDEITDFWNAVSDVPLKSKSEIVRYIRKNRKVKDALHPNFDL